MWLALSILSAALPARAQDLLCDASFEDCRAPLLDLIRNEQVGIDVAFRLMTDARYAQALILRWVAGVPVRVLVDPRAAPALPAHVAVINQLRAAGIPVHLRLSGDVLHWRMMLFTGQRVVQFSGADYTPRAFAPVTPVVDAVDDAIYFTGDPVVVNSFMTRYDDLWVTIGDGTTEAFATPRLRLYPQFNVDPELQLPSAAGLDFGARSALQYRMETTGIDAIVPVITDRRHTDALIDARARGVPIRIISDQAAYRDPTRPWHAWNVDRLHAAGVAVRLHRRSGQTPVTILHGPGRTVFGSSGWTDDSAEPRLEHDYFTTKPEFYVWTVNRFERRWFNGLGIVETLPFTPLPPDVPEPRWPADGAQTQPLDVALQWHPGPWAHRYDVYLGTDPADLALVADDVTLGPALRADDVVTWTVSNLAADSTFYWQVVSRTMAGRERAGPISSFRTQPASAVAGAGAALRRRYAIPRSASTQGQSPQEQPPTAPVRQTAGAEAGAGGPSTAPASTLPDRDPTDEATATGRIAQPRSPVEGVCLADLADCEPPASEPDPEESSESSGSVSGGSDTLAASGYPGREADAEWRREALERIERIRKSDIEITVVDADGQPVEGAEISLQMTRHRFGFGSAVTAHDLTADTEDARRYRAVVERSFNRVVFENDLKWHNWVKPEISFHNRDQTFRALEWLNSRRIDVRGHYVVWGRLTGDRRLEWYEDLGPEDFSDALLRDAKELVTAIGSRVREWDVVNHSNGRDEGTLIEPLGREFYDEVFRGVAEWQPDVRRYINEGDVLSGTRINRDRYYALIEEMLSRGAPLQGIGMMGHFFSDHELVPPEELLAVFDRYATFGLPLLVTEFDFWTLNESLQGDFTRDFLIAAFSHLAVEGVVMWGFWEGRHWHPAAALYRRDWSPKPNGRAWEDLVLRQWWTTDQGATTGAGVYRSRGFHGTYDLEVEHGGRLVLCRLALGPHPFKGALVIPLDAAQAPAASSQGGELTCGLQP